MSRRTSRSLGRRVRILRKRKGLTQEEFADSIGLDRTYVSGIERGVRNPTLEVIGKIAAGLGVSLGSLLKGVD